MNAIINYTVELNNRVTAIEAAEQDRHERRLAARARRREFKRIALQTAVSKGLNGAARTAHARKLYQESLEARRVVCAA